MAANHDQPSAGGRLASEDATVVSCGRCLKNPTPGHPLRFCGRCKSIQYCNVSCQRADWARHKETCTLARDVRRSTPAAERNLGLFQPIQPLREWYLANPALASYVMCLAWRRRSESPVILVQTCPTIGKWRVSIWPRSEWEADREAAQMFQAAANAAGVGGGGASSVSAQQQLSIVEEQATAFHSALQRTPCPDSEIAALAAALRRLDASGADEFGVTSANLP